MGTQDDDEDNLVQSVVDDLKKGGDKERDIFIQQGLETVRAGGREREIPLLEIRNWSSSTRNKFCLIN